MLLFWFTKIKGLKEKEVRYAGFSRRLLAHNIDLIPMLLFLYLVSLIIPNTGFDWLFFSVIYLLYNGIFETSGLQGTPGKKWSKIRVVSDRGPLSFFQSLVRNSCKFLSLILFFGGFILILFDHKKKGLHDYLARTLVLFDEE